MIKYATDEDRSSRAAANLSTGLVYYFVGNQWIDLAFLRQDGSSEMFRAARCADAIPRIDDLLLALQEPQSATPSTSARIVAAFSHGWGRELLPPATWLADLDVLIIIPHHVLHGVPLHIVVPDHKDALAVTHGISYCSSATLFARCVARNAARMARNSKRKCAVGSIDILTGKNDQYRGLASSFASHFGEPAWIDSRSQLKDFLVPGKAADVLCIVCHGFHDLGSALRSGLGLADRYGVSSLRNIMVHEDSVIRIRDWPFAELPVAIRAAANAPANHETALLSVGELLVNCTTTAELVALFGCSTGTGHVGIADDYESLAYQWLKLGAASVLANLWEADLPVLTNLANRFATIWAPGGIPKAIALRNATRELLEENPQLSERPALWGSLALLGDWF